MTGFKGVLCDAVITIQLGAATVGLTLYVASFMGYGWESGAPFILPAFISIALTSIPTTFRDRRFFLEKWGFGLIGMRQHFPFQFFPARRVEWLNPIGWIFMGVLLLHFAWLVLSAQGEGSPQRGTGADLRYVALMITVGGVLAALGWIYPPTEGPAQPANA